MARFAVASDADSVRPDVIRSDASGPIALVDKSTPETVNVFGVMRPPPLAVPDTLMSLRFSAPVAAATPDNLAIERTEDPAIGPSPPAKSRLLLNLPPGVGRALPPEPLPKVEKPPGPPVPAFGTSVTVMS